MITFRTGDILRADAQALINTVNCVGVMGRGIALQFKKAFPDNFRAYAAACRREEVQPGRMFVFEIDGIGNPRFIINFPTKRHWRGNSRLEDIRAGLDALVEEIRARGIASVAIPPLGSGLGGLDWSDVRPMIEAAMNRLPDVAVAVYEPRSEPVTLAFASAAPRMTPARAALVELIRVYLEGLLDPSISLLEVHKLMYFLQKAGEPLQLDFVQAHYGPYAQNLRHLLHAVEGHYIVGFADGGDTPNKELELVPGAIADASETLKDAVDTRSRLKRVAALVGGYESSFGMELLSTVHWVAAEQRVDNAESACARVYSWSERKRIFSERQIVKAYNHLGNLGWLTQ